MHKLLNIAKGIGFVCVLVWKGYDHVKARYDLGEVAYKATEDDSLSIDEILGIIAKGKVAHDSYDNLRAWAKSVPW